MSFNILIAFVTEAVGCSLAAQQADGANPEQKTRSWNDIDLVK